MSRQNISKKQTIPPKKFCKVCLDAGKSESEYTSHFVRASPEPSAKVTCPTLLGASCGYCHEKGHTPTHCKLLKTHKKEKMREEQAKKETAKPVKKVEKLNPCGGFSALMDSSDDEEEKIQVKQEIIKLNSNKNVVQKTPAVNQKEAFNCAFPALPSTSAPSSTSAKSVAKSQLAATLKQMCPDLEVGKSMPEVNTYRPPIAKLVRLPRKLTPEEEKDQFINNYIANQLKTDPIYQRQNKALTLSLAETRRSHASHYGEEDLLYEQASMCRSSGYDVSEIYQEALKAYKISQMASNIDWAQEESDSDDEDW